LFSFESIPEAVHAAVRPGSESVWPWAVRHRTGEWVVVTGSTVLVRVRRRTVRAGGVVQGIGCATDGDTTEGSLSRILPVSAVGGTVAPGVATVVTLVLLAAFGGIFCLGVGGVVAVVVDAGRSASSYHIAATVAGTGVYDGPVRVRIGFGAKVAIGWHNARPVGEVAAIGDATGSGVGK